MMKKKKAIALVSGGLDSFLAAKLVQMHGVDILAFFAQTAFNHPPGENNDRLRQVIKRNLNSPVRIEDLTMELLERVKNPQYGLGKRMNPCVDCKILFIRRALEIMKEEKAHFIITGEVLGQRPMSQHRSALDYISKHSGAPELILRPLSAKLLKPTTPEIEGWVDREKLLDISGRSRKSQLKLAEEFDIQGYGTPAGGCLLTDVRFSERLEDLLDADEADVNSVELLRLGRHFRLAPRVKAVIGRNEQENEMIAQMVQEHDTLLEVEDYGSPVTLLRGKEIKENQIRDAVALTVRYSGAKNIQNPVSVRIWKVGEKETEKIQSGKMAEERIKQCQL